MISTERVYSTSLRLRAIMRIKNGSGNMAQDVYNNPYGSVKYRKGYCRTTYIETEMQL